MTTATKLNQITQRRKPETAHIVYVTLDGKSYDITVTTLKQRESRPKKMIAHIWNCPTPVQILGMERPEYDGNDLEWVAYRRAEIKIQRAFLEQAMVGLTKTFVGLVLPTKWSFSQKAGCSCGCSPGFVGSDGTRNEILYISIKAAGNC